MSNQQFLSIFYGPMFAGKTTKLHTQMTEYKYNRTGYNVICINHGDNVRYGTSNSITHKQQSSGEHIEIHHCITTNKLMDLLPKYLDNNNVFIVDEGQFYPDLLEFVNIILSYRKNIVIGGLDYDIERRRFGQMLDLVDMINSGHFAKSCINAQAFMLNNEKCMECDVAKATHTIRCDTTNNEQVSIGGENEYKSACAECWRLWDKKRNTKPITKTNYSI